MTTWNRPIRFAGTPAQAAANRATHQWSRGEDGAKLCWVCDAASWHAAAEYPCGEPPPREILNIGPPPVEAPSLPTRRDIDD